MNATQCDSYYAVGPKCQVKDCGRLYETYIGCKADGCFVEVGAFDGETYSNTPGLADMGWTGYYIDPIPVHVTACRHRHKDNPKVAVSECAIGATTCTVRMVSALQNSQIVQKDHPLFDNLDAQQITLDRYLTEHSVPPGFDLLVIDTEGNEPGILRAFDICKWRPAMVIIEEHGNCSIVRFFEWAGYRPVYIDKTNTVYVRGDIAD